MWIKLTAAHDIIAHDIIAHGIIAHGSHVTKHRLETHSPTRIVYNECTLQHLNQLERKRNRLNKHFMAQCLH